MKKSIFKAIALMMVFVMVFSLAACGSAEKKTEEPETSIDWTKYPESFDDWTIAEMKDYLRSVNVIVDNEWVFDMSAGDLEAVGAKAGTMYVDTTGGTITDIIMEFAPDSATLEEIRTTHEAVGVAMDGALGSFAFSYAMGSDEEHINLLVQAIKDLGTHYGVNPDYLL